VRKRPYLVVPHTHWDREWYLPFQRFRLRLVGLMDRVLELASSRDAFCFTVDGQMAAVEDYLEIRPERRAELAELVRAGRVAVGPWLVLADEWLTSAESLVRNLEMGQAAASALGGSMPIAYLPDQFGHVAQMPQLLARSGFDRVVLWRGVPSAVDEHRFEWVAPDGSSVVAEYLPSGYGNAMPLERARTAEELAERLSEVEANVGSFYPEGTPVLAMMGTDHFVPTAELVDRLLSAGLELATLPEALERLDHVASGRELLRWQGELRSAARANLLADVVSTRWHLKTAMSALERRLERTVEPFAALWVATWPEAELALAWRWCVQCSNHDSVTGCGADETAADVAQRLRHARELADGLAEQTFVELAQAVPTGELAVLNPSPFARKEVVVLAVADERDTPTPALLDTDGRGWTTQELGRAQGLRRLAALASAPALGWSRWQVGTLAPETLPVPVASARTDHAGAVVLDNGTVSVRLGPLGQLRLAGGDGAVAEGFLRILDEGEAGDSYTHAPPEHDTVVTEPRWGRVQLVSTGPLVASAHLDLIYAWPSGLSGDRCRRSPTTVATTVGIDVEVRLGEPFVRMDVAFDNACLDHRVRLLFPLAEPADAVAAEGQLAVVVRQGPTEAGHGDAPVGTHPARHFADAGGLGVLLDGVREVELLGGTTLALTLLRSSGWLSRDDNARRTEPAGPELPVPGAQCLGPVAAHLALLVHTGDWERGGLVEAAERFAHPLEVVPGVGEPDDASYPAARAGLSISGETAGVVLSALRRRGDWLEVRLAAERTRPAAVTLGFGDAGRLIEARRADLLGRRGAVLPLDPDGSLPLSLQPFEVATLQVRLERPVHSD